MTPSHASLPSTADLSKKINLALGAFADDFLETHRRKVKKRWGKLLSMPHKQLVAYRVKKLGKALEKISASTDGSHFPNSFNEAVLQSRLPFRVKRDITAVVVRALALHGAREAAIRIIHSLEDAEPESRWLKFTLLQEMLDVVAASAYGRELLKSSQLSEKRRRDLQRQPSMVLTTRELLVEKASPPNWRVSARVAYIASSSLPYKTSGYTTRTHGVAAGFIENGLDVQVITRPSFPLNLKPEIDVKKVSELDVIDSIPYHRLLEPDLKKNAPVEWVILAADALEAKIRQLRPELVIAASNYLNSLPALIAARRLGLPFAYEVRGMPELSRVSRVPRYIETADFAVTVMMETFVALNADFVLTLTDQMKADLVQRGVPGERISIMPNGVGEKTVVTPARDEALAKKLRIPAGVSVIGYVGSILEYEGLPDLARACVGVGKRGCDFRLLIVGGEKRNKLKGTPISDEIRAVFHDAGMEEKLIMPGQVPFDDVNSFYSTIDIAPIPRRPYRVSEMVSPIKPVEALAMGKVLILSDVEALKEFSQNGRTGLLFEKGNVSDLEEKLFQALNDPHLQKMLSANGQEFVRATRTWPAICAAAMQHLQLAGLLMKDGPA